MLVCLGQKATARGITGLDWHWRLDGWCKEAPNAGLRWRVTCGTAEGRGHTGEEALRNLLSVMGDWPPT